MGLKSKHLLNRTNSIVVTIAYDEDGETKEGALTIRHRVLTPELWAKVRPAKLGQDGEASPVETKDSLVSELLELLIEWDVEGEDGHPLPVNEETLGRIDYKLLKEIDLAIFAYTFPNLTT